MEKLKGALACAALLCVCAGAAAGSAAAGPGKIAWSKCYAQLGPFECGTVQVPLDYDQPNGATISLAVVRLPATDQAHRIGSLFLNPGGPGGSGVDYTLFAGPFLYTPEVGRGSISSASTRAGSAAAPRSAASAPTSNGRRTSRRSRSRAIRRSNRSG